MRGVRWLLLVLAAVLFVAWGALWVRSYWRIDCVRRPMEWMYMGSISIFSNCGMVQIAFGGNLTSPKFLGELRYESMPAGRRVTTAEEETRGIAGFRIPTTQPRYAYRWYVIPHWLPAAVLAFALWRLARPIWRNRHTPGGHCRVCGYDLRATPDRCPECGTAVVG